MVEVEMVSVDGFGLDLVESKRRFKEMGYKMGTRKKMQTREFDYGETISMEAPVESIVNLWRKKNNYKTRKEEHFRYTREEDFIKEMTAFIAEKKDNIITIITLKQLETRQYHRYSEPDEHYGRFLVCYEEEKTDG